MTLRDFRNLGKFGVNIKPPMENGSSNRRSIFIHQGFHELITIKCCEQRTITALL